MDRLPPRTSARQQNWIALEMKGKSKKERNSGKRCEERMNSCFPPLPHAWEFEGWPDPPGRCRLRTSPVSWLGGGSVRGWWTGVRPSRGGAVKKQRSAAVAYAETSPPYSRASATA